MTESDLVTAQAAYIYPRAGAGGRPPRRTRSPRSCARPARRDLATVKGQYVPGGWFARGYSGAPAVRGRRDLLRAAAVGAARGRGDPGAGGAGGRELPPLPGRGRGARGSDARSARRWRPARPTRAPRSRPSRRSTDEHRVARRVLVRRQRLVDMGARGARRRASARGRNAWTSSWRNTLTAHAAAFPNHWDGLIIVDDECAAYYQRPNSGCGIGLATGEGASRATTLRSCTSPPTACSTCSSWPAWTPTGRGYRIVPHLPMSTFNVRFANVGDRPAAGPAPGLSQDGRRDG